MQPLDFPGLVAVPGALSNSYPTLNGYAQEGIVLHTMVGTLAACDSWFANPTSLSGTHFGVGRAGEVHQYFDLGTAPYAHGAVEAGYRSIVVQANVEIAGGAANPNYYLIGIEHDDRGRPGTPEGLPTPAQLAASVRLAAAVWRARILPHVEITGAVVDEDHVIRHADISPRSKPHCPGWPADMLAEYIAAVARELSPGTDRAKEYRDYLDGVTWAADTMGRRLEAIVREAGELRRELLAMRADAMKRIAGMAG